jgi:hypothetical protein
VDLNFKDILIIAFVTVVTWVLTTWWVALGILVLASLFHLVERHVVVRIRQWVVNRQYRNGNHT